MPVAREKWISFSSGPRALSRSFNPKNKLSKKVKKRNLLTAALALTCASLTAFSAKALTYNAGDLLLGFYATGGTGSDKSLVVNLGQASNFIDLADGTSIVLSLGNIGQDLIDTFGASWNTRSDVKWGVFGTTYAEVVGDDPAHTLYGTRRESTPGTLAQAYNRGSLSTQSQPSTRIRDLGNLYASGSATANSGVATIQPTSANNDFAGFQTNSGTLSFGYFNGALANFGDGTANSFSDLFRMETGSSSLKGTYEGKFSLSDAGVVTYAAPVPEPSTYGIAMGVGALVLVALRRRRQAAKA